MQISRSVSILSPYLFCWKAVVNVFSLLWEFKELALAPMGEKVTSINVKSNARLLEVSSRINPQEKFNQPEWHEGPVPSADSDGAEPIFYPGLKMKMSIFERFTTSFWSITFPFQALPSSPTAQSLCFKESYYFYNCSSFSCLQNGCRINIHTAEHTGASSNGSQMRPSFHPNIPLLHFTKPYVSISGA